MENYESVSQQLVLAQEREKELRAKFEELSDFIENAAVPLHWVNGSGIITWVNQATLDLLGCSRQEVVNKHISKFHADKEVIEEILARLMNRETLMNYPARLVCKNGDIKDVMISSNVRWKGNEFIHTRCFVRDITELKREEEKKDLEIFSLRQENEECRLEINKLKMIIEELKYQKPGSTNILKEMRE